ncbi:MAG: WYL domain-containing protein [Ilumatobacteraceae bacterium]
MAISPVERITNLLTLLLETRVPVTLRQISTSIEGYPAGLVALRGAFERDKALLRDIGVPLETTVLGGDQAGETAYTIDRDRYELRGLELDDAERHALQMAVATLRSDTGQDAVWKLGGSVVPTSTVVANVVQLPSLPSLRAAVAERRPVRFTYRAAVRTLDPYGLLLREGFWYVMGHDHGHAEVRTYRVDRIDGEVEAADGPSFERPTDFDARAVFPSDAKMLGDVGEHRTAQVAVFGPTAQIVRRELGDAAVVADGPSDATTFDVPCANLDAFRSWVLGLGVHAEVLAPPEVRADVVTWLRGLAGAAR